jgi:hypothetical protein
MQTQHGSPQRYQTALPTIGHSTELEHRLTRLEVWSDIHQEDIRKMRQKLTLQERGLLLLMAIVSVLAHEKLPWLAKFLVDALKAAL